MCRFFSFVLISCKKSRKSRSHICDPSELAQSSFGTKKTVWKVAGVFRKKNEMFSKKNLPALRVAPFQFFFLKFKQSRTKIVRLIAKERLSGPSSFIINIELEFEGSGKALHYLSTLIWGERGENWVVSRICAPDCRYYFCLLYLAFV